VLWAANQNCKSDSTLRQDHLRHFFVYRAQIDGPNLPMYT
jgi:hypothetical protein